MYISNTVAYCSNSHKGFEKFPRYCRLESLLPLRGPVKLRADRKTGVEYILHSSFTVHKTVMAYFAYQDLHIVQPKLGFIPVSEAVSPF